MPLILQYKMHALEVMYMITVMLAATVLDVGTLRVVALMLVNGSCNGMVLSSAKSCMP